MYLILHTLKAHRGTYLVGRDYRAEYQSVYPSNVCSSGGVPDYIDVAARLYIILNKSALSFKLMMNYYI